ncbi:MAG: type I-C CRISPR-associated protein Cas5c [Dehalococcoidia bacterium]|nr:type I-C CRISPR-associated protein Cas5c [Dehalococcoidia bacterium]
MTYGFKIEIWGSTACFSRPELKVERVSYEVITPSAARGILEAIMWKPAIKYVIDEIAVCAPIRFENIRRNEVGFKANSIEPKIAVEERQQRASLVLKDVRYVVTAHFILTDKAEASDNEGKFAEMIRRRLEKGQNFHMPYLGTREFPANVRLISDGEMAPVTIDETRVLGLMLHDIEYVTGRSSDGMEIVKEFIPTYFFAVMEKGIIDLRGVEVLR